MLSVQNVSKSFGDLRVLREVSLSIESQDTVVIIGPSGSGKSTLLRCINLLEPINGGSILFDGEDITHTARKAHMVRRDLGMVFQNFELFRHLTALENIVLAPMKVLGQTREEAQALARDLLEKVHIPDKADFYPEELSGGQQQRVAIARALAMKPKLMLYDEPTSALDPEMIKEVLDVIRELSVDGMTQIVVTHEMGFARNVADRIVFMDNGEVVDDTSADAFFGGKVQPRTERFLDQILEH